MKSRAAMMTILPVLFLVAPASADLMNLLSNSGFETGLLDPFYEFNPDGLPVEDPWIITDSNPHSGNYSAYCGPGSSPYLRQDIDGGYTMADLQEYSFWVQLAPDTIGDRAEDLNAICAVEVTNVVTGIGYGFGGLFYDLPVGEWTQRSLDPSEYIADGDSAENYRIDAFVIWTPMGNSIFIDDIMLTVPEPASLSLLALGALCVMRRRR